MGQIEEEVRELRAAISEGRARTVEEMGDLLFSVANLSRQLQIEPESALQQANDKFTRRFDAVEARLEAAGSRVHDASAEALDAAWTAVKQADATPASSTPVRSSTARAPRGRRSRP
jgi:ATP diphosphatase